MKAPELLSELRTYLAPQSDLHVLLLFLADRIVEARLADGGRIVDSTDCKQWLQELAKEARG
jgi:hypothetical protein